MTRKCRLTHAPTQRKDHVGHRVKTVTCKKRRGLGSQDKQTCLHLDLGLQVSKTEKINACNKINQSLLKEIKPEYSLEGLMLKLKLQYFDQPDAKSRLTGKDPDAGKD